MPKNKHQPICSIIIPAHNEELIIGNTLDAVFAGARNGEFDVIVVCNGCTDSTAAIVAKYAANICIIETATASKTNALNLGLKAANTYPIVFLDADISTSASSIRMMVHQQNLSGAHMAYGRANFEMRRCSWLVRAFYKAWQQNPYFDRQKMGGFFSLSHKAVTKLVAFPKVLNDDEFVRRTFLRSSVRVTKATYIIRAPHTLSSLINVRSRIYRGNKALANTAIGYAPATLRQNSLTFALRLLRKPSLWLGGLVFILTAIAAHSKNSITPSADQHWDRDVSARMNVSEG